MSIKLHENENFQKLTLHCQMLLLENFRLTEIKFVKTQKFYFGVSKCLIFASVKIKVLIANYAIAISTIMRIF